MCVLGTENFFSDHTGVVLYDPIYHESKFKLLEQNAVNCTAIDYNETTGTLVYGDVLGRIVACSIQNPRRLFAMSRKGYHATVLINTEVKVARNGQYGVHFTGRHQLEGLLEVKEKTKEHSKSSITEGLVTNYAATWSTLKWASQTGARSTWLLGGSATGLVRVWDVSVSRKKEKFGRGLSRQAFESLCKNSCQ